VQDIQRKPVALDSLSFAPMISPTNGRNIIILNTTCKKKKKKTIKLFSD
jgi:hypothetical protein